eukprot:scaffold8535_cov24-Cyclotella_meneghiniana.AAC.2
MLSALRAMCSIADRVRIAVEDVYSDSEDDDVCPSDEHAIPFVFETPVSNLKGATATSKERQNNKTSDGGCVVEDGSDGFINLSAAFRSRKKRILLSDLILCKLPIEPDNAEKYAKEVLVRLARCVQRGQLDEAMSVVGRDAKEDRYNNAEFTVGSFEMDKKYTLMNIRRYSSYDTKPEEKLKNVLLDHHPELEESSVLDRVRQYETALLNEINCNSRSITRVIINETIRRKEENEELSSPNITVGKVNKLLTETRFATISEKTDELSCQNCKRHNVVSGDPSSVYFFDLYKVYSDDISTQSPLRTVTSSCNRKNSTELLLCTECMQTYWRESLVYLDAWESISRDAEPSSYFDDRTVEIEKFHCDVKSYTMKKTRNALDPNRNRRLGSPLIKPMMIPDVLCPWGCSEFAFRSEGIDACLIIQHHLPKLRRTSIRTVRKGKFNTSPSSFIQNHSYTGIDSADIEINSSGSIVSKGRLTAMHRAEIMNRDDIHLLGEKARTTVFYPIERSCSRSER